MMKSYGTNLISTRTFLHNSIPIRLLLPFVCKPRLVLPHFMTQQCAVLLKTRRIILGVLGISLFDEADDDTVGI